MEEERGRDDMKIFVFGNLVEKSMLLFKSRNTVKNRLETE